MRTLEEIHNERIELSRKAFECKLSRELYIEMDEELLKEYSFVEASPTAQLCIVAQRLADENT